MPWRRRWVKLWTQEWIRGTTRKEMLPDERSVWADFLALAGDSTEPGIICLYPGVPYTDDQLCLILNITPELLQRAMDKMLHFGKITINNRLIHINTWEKYQSEYDRLKEYRRRTGKDTPLDTIEDTVGDTQEDTQRGNLAPDQTRPDQTRRRPEEGIHAGKPALEDWLEKLRKEKNRNARVGILQKLVAFLSGVEMPPSRIGKVLADFNDDALYLATILWQSSAQAKGDLLSYVCKIKGNLGKPASGEKKQLPTTEKLERGWKDVRGRAKNEDLG